MTDNISDADDESSSKKDRKLFVSPPDVSWLKFKFAGVVWRLTRGNPIQSVCYIPGVKRAAKWAFKVRVMSRDFEVTEIKEDDEKSDDVKK